MKILGLTGGIGAGKTVVAKRLAHNGAKIVSADEVAREAFAKDSPLLARVRDAFSGGVFLSNNEIDRRALAKLVFGDSQSLKKLDSITHPFIVERMLCEARVYEDTRIPVVFDAPLLIESGLYRHVDEIAVVVAPLQERIARIIARDGCSREDAIMRIQAQLDDAQRLTYATYKIENNSNMEALINEADKLYSCITKNK